MQFESPSLSFKKTVADVEILPRNRSQKKHFVFWYVGDHLLWKTDSPESFEKLSIQTPRTTKLSDEKFSLSLPEHLSSVFLLWPEIDFSVHLREESPELPLLDGSALPWFLSIRKMAGAPEALRFYCISERFRLDYPFGFCEVFPAETFEVEYSIEKNNYREEAFCAIYSPEDLFSIFSSRTFIFEEDYRSALSLGLLQGAREDSGILLSESFSSEPKKVLAGGKLRFKNEPALHKILDLIGDFSLAVRALPRCRIRIHNGGHAIHHKLYRRIFRYVYS